MDKDNYWLRRNRLTRRRFVAGAGVMAAGSAAMLAGCGDDDDDDEPAATGTSAATTAAGGATTAAASATTAAPSAEQPKRGGTFKAYKFTKGAGFDPAVFHLDNREVIEHVLNFPISYQVTKDKVGFDGMVSYELADPKTLIWKVRPGMKFQNGDPLGAKEWAFSVERVMALNKAKGGSTHTPPPSFNYIERLEVVDDVTVKEIWKRPSADAIFHRARHYYGWVNPKVVEAKGVGDPKEIQDLPAGAGGGPYTFDRNDATGTLVKRWPGYYKYEKPDDDFVADGGPYIDAFETRILPDRAAAKAAFIAGDIDAFGSVDKLEVDEFKGNNKVKLFDVPATGTSLLGFDGGKFFDVRARQAIYQAVDYEKFIAAIRAGNGQYQAPINNAITAYQKLTQDQLKKYYKFDPANAKKLWQAAAPPITEIKILISTGNALVIDIYDFIAKSLKDTLGINTKVDAVDVNTWAARAIDRKNPVKDWELLGYGDGIAGSLTGEPSDTQLVHFDPRGYGINAFNFYDESPHASIKEGSAKFNELNEKQAQEFDKTKRAAMLTELQTFILENAWCNFALPTAKSAAIAFNARVRNQAPEDWLNHHFWRRQTMWLA